MMPLLRMRKRTGFTLLELLVVIGIIAVLVSLLLPAVQQAREAARRTQCRNNLKQMLLSLHNYHDAHRLLPPGYVYRPGPNGENMLGFGWSALVLPFLDQAPLYQRFNWNVPLFDPANQQPRELHLTTYLCPSDGRSAQGFVTMGPVPEQYAMSSFVANFGPPDLDANQEQRTGVFSRNSSTGFRDITDGLTTTLFLGERENGPFRNGAAHGNHFEYETAWAGAIRDWDDPTDDHGHMVLFQTGHGPNAADSDDRDISSAHVGIVHFGLGDGSVRAISENVSFSVYQALSTRASDDATGEF